MNPEADSDVAYRAAALLRLEAPKALEGQAIRTPSDRALWPDRERLAVRFERFRGMVIWSGLLWYMNDIRCISY
jgi:hypothetical protein